MKNFLRLIKENKIIISIILVVLLAIIVLVVLLFPKPSTDLKLNNFEKATIYGYLEDFLQVDKLYAFSNSNSYDELQYTQAKIKTALDLYFSNNNVDNISTQSLNDLLQKQYNISTQNLDYHGILVSGYEFIPEENVMKKSPNANSSMIYVEQNVHMNDTSNEKVSVNNIEKISDNGYKVYFDIRNNSNTSEIIKSGNTLISVNDNLELKIDSCEFTK